MFRHNIICLIPLSTLYTPQSTMALYDVRLSALPVLWSPWWWDWSRISPCKLELGETELQHILSRDSFDLFWLEGGDAVLQDCAPEREEVRGPDYQAVHEVLAGAGELVAANQPAVLHRGRHPLPPDGDGQRAQVLVNTKPVLVICRRVSVIISPISSFIAEDSFQSAHCKCKLASVWLTVTHLSRRRSFCSTLSQGPASQLAEDLCWSCKDKFRTSNELTSAPVKRSPGLVWNTVNGSQWWKEDYAINEQNTI